MLIAALRHDPTHIELTVRDAGVGFAPDGVSRAFEPFFTTKRHGLGMGLAICRSIIASHGGAMFGRNNPDRGATVGFTLPCIGAAP